jgi:hypothetical protein
VKTFAAAVIVVLVVLAHLGVIALMMRDARLVAVAVVVALLIIAHVVPKSLGPAWSLPISRRALSAGSAALLITGMALVLAGFLIAHLCNANIDVFETCAYPRSGDFICHKIGPVLLLFGLVGGLVARRMAPTSQT